MSAFKVVITDFGEPDQPLEQEEFDNSSLDINLVRLNTKDPAEIIQKAADADGLLVQWAEITPEIIAKLEKCRVISRYGIGVNNVNLKAAGEHGIYVCNVPDFCIEEVSTTTIGFLVSLNRHLFIQDRTIRSGKWGSAAGEKAPARLAGQVLGTVGFGNIGRATARKAQALGLKVIAFDPYYPAEECAKLGVESVGLQDLLGHSDYVSLHVPLNQETQHLIGKSQLEMMKPTAYLINMARGPVVDQRALVEALQKGIIAGAALDVFEVEPIPVDDPIRKMENVIMTSHSASWSADSLVQLRRDAAKNIVIVLKGNPPRNLVNRNELKR